MCVCVCVCVCAWLARLLNNDGRFHEQTVILDWFKYVSHPNLTSFSTIPTLCININSPKSKNTIVAPNKNILNAEVAIRGTRSAGICVTNPCSFTTFGRLAGNVCIFIFIETYFVLQRRLKRTKDRPYNEGFCRWSTDYIYSDPSLWPHPLLTAAIMTHHYDSLL